jgi:type I restriction enzyme S subunit
MARELVKPTRLKWVLREIDRRSPNGEGVLLAVSRHVGVVPREDITDRESRSESLDGYKVVKTGQFAVNKMRAFNGALGVAPCDGLVSPAYSVFDVSGACDGRYLAYVLRTPLGLGKIAKRIRGIGQIDQGNVRTPTLSAGDLGDIVLDLPEAEVQRRLADYLDRETARIDALIDKKQRLLYLLDERFIASIVACVTTTDATRVVPWVGRIPDRWELAPVYSRYAVQLGKMLDSSRISGTASASYLRNIDVQWGRINIQDLPVMDFDASDRTRYSLRSGDLLVCEGGEVGRAAVWQGELADCFYQKALHRLRPIRRGEYPWFMYYLLRLAVHMGLFRATGNSNTIDHLTAEKLRRHRFPFPPPGQQAEIVTALDQVSTEHEALKMRTLQLIALLQERRQALITAAVTGQLEIPTAS